MGGRSSRGALACDAVDAQGVGAAQGHEPAQIISRVWGRVARGNEFRSTATGDDLLAKPTERSGIVDVIPSRQRHDVEREARGTFDGLLEYKLGAPRDIVEEPLVRVFQSDEIIAAGPSATEHDTG